MVPHGLPTVLRVELKVIQFHAYTIYNTHMERRQISSHQADPSLQHRQLVDID